MILHGYWRSSASYRVRIALALKGLAYAQATHDLRAGAHRAKAYRLLNPQGFVPALEVDGVVLTQSPAILEWLEESHPQPPLLPVSRVDRAMVRAMMGIVACDIHPLNNLRVCDTLRRDFSADNRQVRAWAAQWLEHGFAALERLVERHGGDYAFANRPTLADCYLVPQVYSAARFGVTLDAYPHLAAATARLQENPAVAAAHPELQPDVG